MRKGAGTGRPSAAASLQRIISTQSPNLHNLIGRLALSDRKAQLRRSPVVVGSRGRGDGDGVSATTTSGPSHLRKIVSHQTLTSLAYLPRTSANGSTTPLSWCGRSLVRTGHWCGPVSGAEVRPVLMDARFFGIILGTDFYLLHHGTVAMLDYNTNEADLALG